jgi:non-specific serine/threonine protein kinase
VARRQVAPLPRESLIRDGSQDVALGRTNLPVQLTSFVGRERELAEVKGQLQSTRLLTLTGTGGCGKTRLALQVAQDLVDAYVDGVWLVELAPLADPMLIPQMVAAALGVREEPGQPIPTTLAHYLRAKHLLLLVDNCEHLVDAVAHLVDELLRGCARLQVLATSREALRTAGEALWRVPSLATPPADAPGEAIGRFEAVRLFVERAAATRPAFALSERNAAAVSQTCRRLDGIPLAIELAAARVVALSPAQIAARLDQRFGLLTVGSRVAAPRQQTLRATIDWSYDLLDDRERRLFQRLAVFSGGWTLEATEAISAGEGIERDEVLDLLARLVQKSLVQAEEQPDGAERYGLLETLRQYGRERLGASGEAEAVVGRHAGYYLALAEATWQSRELGQSTWRDELEREHENLRAALRWLVDSKDADRAIRLALVLAPYCDRQGYVAEGRAHMHSVLALARSSAPSVTLADVFDQAARFASAQGDYAAQRTYREEELALYRALGDRDGIADGLSVLGDAHRNLGDYAAAQASLAEALTLHRELHRGSRDRKEMAEDLIRLGELAQEQGDGPTAQQYFQQSGAIVKQLDEVDEFCEFAVRLPHHLGSVALDRGEVAAARAHFVSSLRQLRGGASWKWAPSALADFVALAAADRQPERAVRLGGAVDRVSETIGAALPPGERRRLERWLMVARQVLPEEASASARAEGQRMPLEQAVAYALEEDQETRTEAGQVGSRAADPSALH